MKNKILLLLLVITAFASSRLQAQKKEPYIPVLADSIYWWEVGRYEFGELCLEHYHSIEKQIYNDTVYHKFMEGWHVEDTTERRVYRLSSSPETGTRSLMYDYSLNEGDSVWMYSYTSAYYWFYVDSISYMDTYAGNRKVWYLHYNDGAYREYPIWVEGIGSLAGFWRFNMEPRLDLWGWGILNCWYADDELIYKSDFAEQWGCELQYLDIDDKSKPDITLYPNPVTDISFIEIENTECKEYTITFYTILGKKIYSENTNSNIYQINASVFSNGIYFYVISDNNQIVYNEKFIVNH